MISEKQLEANRANAQQSSGPKTDTGRKRSSMNALRHGLTGQVTTMTDEDRAAHEKFSKALIADFAPQGAMETQLAVRIATDSWRLNRAGAIEHNLFALGLQENGGKLCLDHEQIDAALTTARVFTLESKQLQLLTLYERRLNRAVQKNLAILQQLQTTRKAERAAKMKEAAALLQLSEIRGIEYFPAKAAQAQIRRAANSRQDGFVFSTPEIHASINREKRLKRAAIIDIDKFRPRKFQTQAA